MEPDPPHEELRKNFRIVSRTEPSDRDLPMDDYETLSDEQVLTRSLALSREEVETVSDFERRHKNRRIVLDALERVAA